MTIAANILLHKVKQAIPVSLNLRVTHDSHATLTTLPGAIGQKNYRRVYLMAQERPLLEEMTLRQLRKVASEYNISRYSRMRKTQLITAIEQAINEQNPFNQSTVHTEHNEPISYTQSTVQEEQQVEASKFEVGQEDTLGGSLADVDEGLGELPGGYGQSRIVLLPRDPQWAYTYWDVPNEAKESLRYQGGQQLALRLYDVSDIDLNYQSPHSVQEYLCDEMAREWYLPIPVSDRDYVIDIGYRTFDGRWLILARSAPVHMPPVYPSDWVEDIFVTVNWEEDLAAKTIYNLVPPSKRQGAGVGIGADSPLYDEIFGMAQGAEAQRIAGSMFGSMQHVAGSVVSSYVHQETLSSYVFPSGVGMWAVPNVSGLNMSGVGMGASETLPRPRKFWLVADAELIVYGATEPDATVTIGGRPIKLNPDGTFRFQMSFQDGLIDYPIKAVAVDGEQTRSIHMKFERETPSRHTNTKEEAVLEWLS